MLKQLGSEILGILAENENERFRLEKLMSDSKKEWEK